MRSLRERIQSDNLHTDISGRFSVDQPAVGRDVRDGDQLDAVVQNVTERIHRHLAVLVVQMASMTAPVRRAGCRRASSLLTCSAQYDALSRFALYRVQTAPCPPKSGQECAIWVADSSGLVGYNWSGEPIVYRYAPRLWQVCYELLCEKRNESACIRCLTT